MQVTTHSLEALKYTDMDAHFMRARVGVHSDVQVTSGLKGSDVEMCPSEHQVVHQVFTAAMDMSRLRREMQEDPDVVGLARFLLRVAYRLTILAAIENADRTRNSSRAGKDKLYLTLIGGGVFGNDPAWIYEAIQENQHLIAESGLSVVLVIYNRKRLSAELLSAFKALTEDLHGTVTVVQ